MPKKPSTPELHIEVENVNRPLSLWPNDFDLMIERLGAEKKREFTLAFDLAMKSNEGFVLHFHYGDDNRIVRWWTEARER